ncbi:hypothetical protein SLS62_001917 [Diatrype stigma]|uniref:Uncharacterized protein n=1 Tax=Diatrype stigma TaxID=117547 RepID=A0AAN9YW27_9PEZI
MSAHLCKEIYKVHHHKQHQQQLPDDLDKHIAQQPLAVAREALHGQRPQRCKPPRRPSPTSVAVAVE